MKEIKNVLFVVNPIAGHNDKKELVDFVKAELKSRDIGLVIYNTSGKKDHEKIKKLISEQSFDRVFIAGGDGTIKLAVEAMMHQKLPVAIFPTGSANGFAKNFDIPATKEEQLKVALGEHIFNIDLIQINEHVSLHLADFGVNAELIKNYDESVFRGKIGYLLQTLPTLIKSKHPFKYEIEIEGEVFKREGSVLSIANCQMYGTGARINPTALMNDGKFEIILFKNLNLIDIVKTFTNQIDLDPKFAETFKVSSAIITCKDAVPFQVDGEYLGELNRVEVSVLEKALHLVVPESSLPKDSFQ